MRRERRAGAAVLSAEVAEGEENPPATPAGRTAAGTCTGAGASAGRWVERVGRAARARTVALGISGAQVSQTSSTLHTRRTVASWRRIITTAPEQCVLVSGCVPQCWEPQWHQALGRTVAALACAAACRAAKARRDARSLERGGIRQASVVQVTVAERSLYPWTRTVQARPGMHSMVDSLYTLVTAVRSLVLCCSLMRLHYGLPVSASVSSFPLRARRRGC
ncbi:hypothetical protein GCM10010350_76700 [Streptomyces galilaeus]|nr:hypothetical protein GCM10010350_76700 [Streptomyces galilaeus]